MAFAAEKSMMGFGYHFNQYNQLSATSHQNVEGVVVGLPWN